MARATTSRSCRNRLPLEIDAITGLDEMGRKAQEKILEIPDRLRRIADLMDTRSRTKTFAFEVAFSREFVME